MEKVTLPSSLYRVQRLRQFCYGDKMGPLTPVSMLLNRKIDISRS